MRDVSVVSSLVWFPTKGSGSQLRRFFGRSCLAGKRVSWTTSAKLSVLGPSQQNVEDHVRTVAVTRCGGVLSLYKQSSCAVLAEQNLLEKNELMEEQ